MANFEYKVIPAPTAGKKANGVKGADGRFANALAEEINNLAKTGWEYLRSESLPSVERLGFMRKRREVYQNILVFRRETNLEVDTEIIEKVESFNPFKSFSAKKDRCLSTRHVSPTSDPQNLSENIDLNPEEL